MTSPKIHVAVRLAPEEVAQVDALIPVLSTPWRGATRSDALRVLLLNGLKNLPGVPGGSGGGEDPPAGAPA